MPCLVAYSTIDCDPLQTYIRDWHFGTPLEIQPSMSSIKSGYIIAKEFRVTMEKLGIKLSNGEVDCILKAIDEDHNGRISYVEFIKTVKAYKPLQQAVQKREL